MSDGKGTYRRYTGSLKKKPGTAGDGFVGALKKKVVVDAQGNPFVVSDEDTVIDDATGNVHRVVYEYPDVVSCANPWQTHGLVKVRVGEEGFETEIGNVLCLACWARNERARAHDQIPIFGKLVRWLYGEDDIF